MKRGAGGPRARSLARAPPRLTGAILPPRAYATAVDAPTAQPLIARLAANWRERKANPQAERGAAVAHAEPSRFSPASAIGLLGLTMVARS
jgi:hypothetical protein